MLIVKNLLIRSTDRVFSIPNNYVIQVPLLTDMNQVQLLSASIPNTLYNTTVLNNKIYWN